MTKGLALFAGVVVTATACSPMYLAARPPVDVSGYQGDGTIMRLSHPINPGFKVDFPSFMLDRSYAASLQLDGLPKPRHESPYEVGLVVELTAEEAARWPTVPSWLKQADLGTIALNVVTQSGQSLFTLEAPVSGQYWSRRTDEPQLYAVLRPTGQLRDGAAVLASNVPPDRRPGVLHIEYTPGADSPSKPALVRLVAGGED